MLFDPKLKTALPRFVLQQAITLPVNKSVTLLGAQGGQEEAFDEDGMHVLLDELSDCPDKYVYDAVLRRALEKYSRAPLDTTQISIASAQALVRSKLLWDSSLASFDDAYYQFLTDWDDILDRHGLRELLTDGKKMQKKAVDLLTSCLQPQAWREDVKDAVERASSKTVETWFDVVSDLRVYYNGLQRDRRSRSTTSYRPYDTAAARQFPATAGRYTQPAPPPTSSYTPRPAPVISSGSVARVPVAAPAAVAAAPRPAAQPRPPPVSGCKICKGAHWAVDCPSKGQQGRQDGRTAATAIHIKAAAITPTRTGRHHGHIVVAGHQVPFVFDSGATEVTVGLQTALELIDGSPYRLSEIARDIPVATARDGSAGRLKARYMLEAPAELHSNTGLVVPVEALRFLVVEDLREGEVLFGDRAIQAYFGLNVADEVWSRAYARVAVTQECYDFDETDSVTAYTLEALHATEDDDQLPPEVGGIDRDEIAACLDSALTAAADQGLSLPAVHRLREALHGDLFDVFRVRLGPDPPADVPPVRVDMRPGIETVRQPRRRYSPEESRYMKDMMQTLVEFGYVVTAADVQLASPAHVVRRPGIPVTEPLDKRFRLTFDLRAVNQYTIPTNYPLPDIDLYLPTLARMRYFGKMDLLSSFWQLPLHEDCQKWYSVMTDTATYTSRRLLQGSRNATGPFQAAMVNTLGELVGDCCIVFVDDVFVFGETEDAFVSNWIKILRRLHLRRFKVSVKKTQLYARSVTFCGKVYSTDGITHSPEFTDAIDKLPRPTNVADLRSYTCSANWVRGHVFNMAELLLPLRDLETLGLSLSVSTDSRHAKLIQLDDIGWAQEHDVQFARINRALVDEVKLAYPDPEMTLCVWTDANDKGWAGVITQCLPSELSKPMAEQHHHPLAFFSGLFTGAELRWSTLEQEAFAVKQTCMKGQHLLRRPGGFWVFTDHRNLVFLLSTELAPRDGHRQASDRVERWRVAMSMFQYSIRHVPGKDNVLADLLTRWGSPETRMNPRQHRDIDDRPLPFILPEDVPADVVHVRAVSIAEADVRELSAPTLEEIRTAQQALSERARRPLTLGADGVLRDKRKRVFLPHTSDLCARIIELAHVSGGHRGATATMSWVAQQYVWNKMHVAIQRYCTACVVCARTKGPVNVPRPLLHIPRPSEPNACVHFDFMYIRAATPGTPAECEYVLIIMDAFSRFVELKAVPHADARTVASALLDWFARYQLVSQWSSDRGPHFFNALVQDLQQRLGTTHRFTTAYAPWSNGQVERINREIKALLSAIALDRDLTYDQWPLLIPIVAAHLNNTPSSALHGYAPITLFMGRQPRLPVPLLLAAQTDEFISVPLDKPALDKRIRLLSDCLSTLRDELLSHPQEQHRARPGELPVDFDVGDLVLTARPEATRKDKVAPTWQGPARVIEKVNDRSFLVRNLASKVERTMHAQHLKRYVQGDHTDIAALENIAARGGTGYLVDKILAHRWTPEGHCEFLVRWQGFEDDAGDQTWEPLVTLASDVPAVVRNYATAVQDTVQRDRLVQDITLHSGVTISSGSARAPRSKKVKKNKKKTKKPSNVSTPPLAQSSSPPDAAGSGLRRSARLNPAAAFK